MVTNTKRTTPVETLEARFFSALQPLADVHRWVIAHSGGLDSQVLLHLAAARLPPDRLALLHVNHQLQRQAGQWQTFSADQAAALGIPAYSTAVTPATDSEQAAREARYRAFADFLQPGDCLLLAQHADDQAETLLFRLLRGAGLAGLSAMPAERRLGRGRLLRPLLAVTRAELEAYAAAHRLSWVDDPSNLDSRYDRNFLRHQVLPLLKQRWPGLVPRWVETARLLGRTRAVLNGYLDRELAQLQGPWGQLWLEALPQADAPRREALLRRWLERQAGLQLNSAQLQRLEGELIAARRDAQPRLRLGGVELRRYRGGLYVVLLQDEAKAVATLERIEPGRMALGDGVLQVTPTGPGRGSLAQVRLIRRQGGERCRPHGRGGSCTVKKLLQEQGVPPWLRTAYPLLVKGDEVVAVPGICVCDPWWEASGRYFTLDWRSCALSERG